MKKILLGTVALIAMGLAAPASAADLGARPYKAAPIAAPMMYDWSGFYIGANGGYGLGPAGGPYKAAPIAAPMMYDWSGFYIGANGGYGWSRQCVDITAINAVAFGFAEGCRDAGGGIVGGQIGYRWQAASWVFGLEAQGDWAN